MEKFKGDKRTKAYKDYKAKYEKEQSIKSKGLGDTVEKVLKSTGVKNVVESITDDCGCDERKSMLNRLLPYKMVECLTEDEHSFLIDFKSRKEIRMDNSTQKGILDIYNRVFNKRQQRTSCSTCLVKIVKSLLKLVD